MVKLHPRCMWPRRPGKIKVPLSGRTSLVETLEACGAKAAWKILVKDDHTWVCDGCRQTALDHFDDATAEPLNPDGVEVP